ncbi:S-adenosylmethionine:tRNA ribosyltransferase-isomerase, partial [Candidatus Thiomargarita nelsonii]
MIAQHPLKSRTDSRLLHITPKSGQFQDRHFVDFPSLLVPGDLLVFNNTRVIPARLFGHKASGGKIEILVERVLDDKRVLAQVRASRSPQIGARLYLDNDVNLIVLRRVENFFELQFERPVYEILQAIGHIPLPPYIERADTAIDSRRYQTVYAQQIGAVAAPTAGLHFDEAMLERIDAMGVESAFVTLHVGAGTFASIRVDDIRQHTMHSERLQVSAEVCEQVKATR